MTVQAIATPESYVGNGVTTLFPVNFNFFLPNDLQVTLVDTTSGSPVVSTLALNGTPGYSVAGGLSAVTGLSENGSITTSWGPTAYQTIIITPNFALTQQTHYVPNSPFPAASHENALDRLTLIAQQNAAQLAQALTIPVSSFGVNTQLPAPAPGMVLGWDGTGQNLVNVVFGAGSGAALQALLASPAAGQGDTLLGASPAGVATNQHVLNQAKLSILSFMTPAQYATWLAAPTTTDMTAVLNAATLGAKGATLALVPGATFMVSSIINLYSNSRYEGNGAWIKQISGSNIQAPGGIAVAGLLMLNDSGPGNMEVCDLNVDGNYAGNPTLSYVGGIVADPGLTGATYQNVKIRRCLIQNTWCQGIGANNVSGLEITDNTLYLCGLQANTQSPTNNHGIMFGCETTNVTVGISNILIKRNHIIGSRSLNITRKGITCFNFNLQSGITTNNISGVNISDNTLTNCCLGGIYVGAAAGYPPMANGTIHDNVIAGCYVGIQTGNMTGITLHGNAIQDIPGYAYGPSQILLDSTSFSSIKGNTLDSAGYNGITFSGVVSAALQGSIAGATLTLIAAASFTGSAALGASVIAATGITGTPAVNQVITGTGIAPGTTILGIVGSNITISTPTTGSVSGTVSCGAVYSQSLLVSMMPGQQLIGTGIPQGVALGSLASGAWGAPGSTYALVNIYSTTAVNITVASEAMTAQCYNGYNTVTGNTVKNPSRVGAGSGYGIQMSAVNDSVVQGNTCMDNGGNGALMGYGILEATGSFRNALLDNQIPAAYGSPIYTLGANTYVRRIDNGSVSHLAQTAGAGNTASAGVQHQFTGTFGLPNQLWTSFASQLSANAVNNAVLPAGACSLVIGSSGISANFTINGIVGGMDGQIIRLVNASGYTCTLAYNSGSATAGNKFFMGGSANVTLSVYGAVDLQYSLLLAGWIVVGIKN